MSIPGYKENYAYTSGDSRTNLIPKTCLHLLCFTTVSGKLYLHCKGERVNSLPKLLQHKICHFQSTTPGAQTHPETKLLHFFFVHTPNKIHFLFFLQVVICNNSSFLHIQKPSLLTPQIQTLKPSFCQSFSMKCSQGLQALGARQLFVYQSSESLSHSRNVFRRDVFSASAC